MVTTTTSFLGKTNRAITAAARNTSCNRGWLQVFTHVVCGSFVVVSFVLVLLIAFQIFPKKPNINNESRCQVTGCRIACHNAPYYGEYENEIIMAVLKAETHCQAIYLTLIDPAFPNGSLPQNWLSTLRQTVMQLSIVGGNLHYIPENAFSGAFARNIHILYLEDLTITSWNSHTLLGLLSLETLFIQNCKVLNIEKDVLKPVSLTLKSLFLTKSDFWDPAWMTGTYLMGSLPELATVDFSNNNFRSIIGSTSFLQLHNCISLYLSNSGITHIGPGAFDNLNHIENLYLDNNFIKTVPSELFSNIMLSDNSRFRVNLIHNYWHCDCAFDHLIQLTQRGVLIVDPVCQSPSKAEGKTFTEFTNYCQRNNTRKVIVFNINPGKTYTTPSTEFISNVECQNDIHSAYYNFSPIHVVSPFRDYACSESQFNATALRMSSKVIDPFDSAGNIWMKPTVVIKLINSTMVELGSTGLLGYGLVWYRSSCPNEIFCVNVVPEIIRLYNMEMPNDYIFCPVVLESGTVEHKLCTGYDLQVYSSRKRSVLRILMILLIAVSCLLFGATCLYFLIRKYPNLLKGSKRVLFVKHKTVDALILPPKVPLRNSLLERSVVDSCDTDDVVVPLRKNFIIGGLTRMNSVRSGHSCTPSYISALQPTDEQLADWRLKHGADKFKINSKPISTIASEVPISILSVNDNLYFSIDENSRNSNFICNYLNENLENHSIGIY